MKRPRPRNSLVRDERGSVLLIVAGGLVAIVGMAALAIDLGILFTARSEAQRAAEAGAHAGATVFFNADGTAQAARERARDYAERNQVRWGAVELEPEDIEVDVSQRLVRVSVQRTQERGNPVSNLFARILGINTSNIGAVAAAQIWPGDATTCLLPFAVPDRWMVWDETLSPPDHRAARIGDVYDQERGDYYDENVTGYVAQDVGESLQLTSADPNDSPQPGWYYPIALGPRGANEYREAIASCWEPSDEYELGEEVDKEPGNMVGPTRQGFRDIFDEEPMGSQEWNGAKECPVATSAPDVCLTGDTSRRVRPLVMFDPTRWDEIDQGRSPVPITSIAGVWLESWDGGNVVTARWMRYMAINPTSEWSDPSNSFLMILRIVE